MSEIACQFLTNKELEHFYPEILAVRHIFKFHIP